MTEALRFMKRVMSCETAMFLKRFWDREQKFKGVLRAVDGAVPSSL